MVWLKQCGAILSKESKILLRDRQALRLLFLMPAVFILFLSLALSEVYDLKVGTTIKIALDNQDGQRFANLLERNLRNIPEFEILTVRDANGGGRALTNGVVKALITIPRGFSDDMQDFIDGEGRFAFGIHGVRWQADPTLDASYRWLIDASTSLAAMQAIFDDLVNVDENQPASARPAIVVRAAEDEAAVVPTPLQQTVPGWSLFAMFFISVPLSASFIREMHDGTLSRLLTYRVSRAAIIFGKLTPYFVVNLIQFALMLLVGTVVMPLISDLSLQLGHHPGHLVLVTLTCALAATSFGVILASFCRTADQASAFGAISIIIMAVIGGVMVPHFVMPDIMQKLAYGSPLYWGHQAYLDVLLRGATTMELLKKLGVLVAFSGIALTVAIWRNRTLLR